MYTVFTKKIKDRVKIRTKNVVFHIVTSSFLLIHPHPQKDPARNKDHPANRRSHPHKIHMRIIGDLQRREQV